MLSNTSPHTPAGPEVGWSSEIDMRTVHQGHRHPDRSSTGIRPFAENLEKKLLGGLLPRPP
jgi:hypothetical protein